MESDITIPFQPDLVSIINKQNGKHGLILAHGLKDDMNTGIIPSLAKKLAEKNISSLRFNFPFRINGKKYADDVGTLDNAYLAVWHYATEKYPDINWLVSGIDIGAETAIRASSLMMTPDGSIPTIISLNYPLYPPNKPEQVDASSLGAIMGDALFIQGDESNQGSFDRLRNSIHMISPHAELSKIRGANHEFKVKDKTFDRVAFWISNDIEKFIKNAYGYL